MIADDGSLPIWRRGWFQWLLGAALVLAVVWLVAGPILRVVYVTRPILLPVLIGLVLAYICNPLVTWMHRRGRVPRWLGTSFLLTTAGLMLLLAGMILIPLMVRQAGDLTQKLRQVYPKVVAEWGLGEEVASGELGSEEGVASGELDGGPDASLADSLSVGVREEPGVVVDAGAGEVTLPPLLSRARARLWMRDAAGRLDSLEPGAVVGFLMRTLDIGVEVIGSIIGTTTYLALAAMIVLFCFFYFSWKFDDITAWPVGFIPLSRRARVLDLTAKMDRSVSAFIRGRLIQAAVAAVVLSIGWGIVGVPYWLLLGVLGGVLNLIPYAAVVVWPLAVLLAWLDAISGGVAGVAAGEAVASGAMTAGAGMSAGQMVLWVLVLPTAVYVLAQTLDGWIVEPVVQGQATQLDPLTILLVVLLGGSLAGLLGLMIAIPTAACLKIIMREVALPKLRAWAAGN